MPKCVHEARAAEGWVFCVLHAVRMPHMEMRRGGNHPLGSNNKGPYTNIFLHF